MFWFQRYMSKPWAPCQRVHFQMWTQISQSELPHSPSPHTHTEQNPCFLSGHIERGECCIWGNVSAHIRPRTDTSLPSLHVTSIHVRIITLNQSSDHTLASVMSPQRQNAREFLAFWNTRAFCLYSRWLHSFVATVSDDVINLLFVHLLHQY